MSNLSSRGTLRGTIYRGGGGGITDYNFLSGKPQINDVTIEGNHSGNYYSLMDTDDIDIIKITDLQRGNNYGITLFGTNYGIINMDFAQNESGLVPGYSAADAGKILSTNGWIDAPSNNINYSTTEQKTGQKWIDGKDIYFKTIQLGSTVETTSWFSIEPHNNIYDRVIRCYASGSYFSTDLLTAHNDDTYLEGRTPYAVPIDTVTIYYTKQ